MRKGSETIAGLGLRKQEILGNGGTILDLAVAMLETRDMTATYPLGDVNPDGQLKTGDAANFGIFKQNWLMIRSSVPQYANATEQQYLWGTALNHNLSWDIQVLHASQTHYTLETWFAGHRGGESGLNGVWNRHDIRNYRRAVYWIRDQINGNASYRSDDTRFWVEVPAV